MFCHIVAGPPCLEVSKLPAPPRTPLPLRCVQAEVAKYFKRQPLEPPISRNNYATVQDFTLYKFYNEAVVTGAHAKHDAPQAGRMTGMFAASPPYKPKAVLSPNSAKVVWSGASGV